MRTKDYKRLHFIVQVEQFRAVGIVQFYGGFGPLKVCVQDAHQQAQKHSNYWYFGDFLTFNFWPFSTRFSLVFHPRSLKPQKWPLQRFKLPT